MLAFQCQQPSNKKCTRILKHEKYIISLSQKCCQECYCKTLMGSDNGLQNSAILDDPESQSASLIYCQFSQTVFKFCIGVQQMTRVEMTQSIARSLYNRQASHLQAFFSNGGPDPTQSNSQNSTSRKYTTQTFANQTVINN